MKAFEATWELTGGGSETVTVNFENLGWTAQGVNTELGVQYVIRLSPAWQVRQLLLFRDLDEPDLWLATDGGGRWGEMNGSHRLDLDGCTDLAISGSVFSLALPVLRLPLHVGDRAEVKTAEVDSGFLMVLPQHERYARLSERRWRRESVTVDVVTEWDTDGDDLPLDVPGFRRVGR